MGRLKHFMLFVVLIVSLIFCNVSQAAEPGFMTDRLSSILKDITSEDASVRSKAFKEVLSMGKEGITQLVKLLAESEEGKDAGMCFALHGLAVYVIRPGAEAERATFAKALCSQFSAEMPTEAKRFLIRQLQVVGKEESVPTLARYLLDETLADAALEALAVNPSKAGLKALRDSLSKTKGIIRVSIIQTLGRRQDVEAVRLLIAETSSSDPSIRIAAIEALGQISDPKAESIIFSIALNGREEQERCAALDSYLRFAERLAETKKVEEAARVYTRVLRIASSSSIRRAALRGIGKVGSVAIVNTVIPYISDSDPTVYLAAMECLAKLPGPETTHVIVKAMERATPVEKAALLRALAKRKDLEASKAVEEAANDPDPEVRVTACYLLGKLDDPTLEPMLLRAAIKGSDMIHPVAMSAYMRLAEARLRNNERDAALKMFCEALIFSRIDELRCMALRGMEPIASPETLAIIESLLEQDSLRDDAIKLYFAIAANIAQSGDKSKAIEMLQKVIRMNPPRDTLGKAVEELRKLGVEVDPAREAGFITSWWIIGPFPGREIDKQYQPEKDLDLKAVIKVDGKELRWVRHHVTDVEGIVDLANVLGQYENSIAYLYGEIIVEKAQDVLFKMGSDDGIKCWLNGKLIHRHLTSRGITVDQDVVKTRLEAGLNRILIKIVNEVGGWAGCLRITDLDGKPIKQAVTTTGWIELFNGKDLTGWRLRHEGGKNGWGVVNGALAMKLMAYEGTDLVSEQKFMGFELHVEFNLPKGSDSPGVYLQGRYEIQIDDSYGQGISNTMCGAIYGKIAPKVNAAKPVGEWQTLDINFFSARRDETGKIVKKARVTVIHNGIPIIEDAEIDGVTGGALDDNEGTPGPVMLQGDHGPIQFRNIKIRPLN